MEKGRNIDLKTSTKTLMCILGVAGVLLPEITLAGDHAAALTKAADSLHSDVTGSGLKAVLTATGLGGVLYSLLSGLKMMPLVGSVGILIYAHVFFDYIAARF